MVCPQLTEVLMEEYGWRGCYLVMAGITLNFCVCASLMRPLTPPARHRRADDGQDAQSQAGDSGVEEGELTFALCGDRSHIEMPSSLSLEYHLKNPNKNNLGLSLVSLEEIEECRDDPQRHTKHHHSGIWSSVKSMFLSNLALSGGPAMVPNRREGGGEVAMTRSVSHSHLQSSTAHRPHFSAHVNVLSTWLACQVPPSLSRPSLRHSHHSLDTMGHSKSVHGHPKVTDLPWSRPRNCSEKLFHSDSRVACGQASPFVERSEHYVRTVLMKNQHKAHASSLLALKVSSRVEMFAGYNSENLECSEHV